MYPTGPPLISTSIDPAQFGSLEVYATYLEYVRLKKNLWLRIGDGGSISSEVLAHEGSIYFGACDHVFYAVSADGVGRITVSTDGDEPVDVHDLFPALDPFRADDSDGG